MKSVNVDRVDSTLRILYLGVNDGTSGHRAHALGRLGHDVDILDPWEFLPTGRLASKGLNKLIYEGGAAMFEPYVGMRLFGRIGRRRYDVVWVNHGELLGRSTVSRLKSVGSLVINYNIDDPFGNRDKRRFSLYRKAVPAYDLVVVVREENVTEAYDAGARRVLRVYRSADEVAHRPVEMTAEEKRNWASEVLFVGTWMPERGLLLSELIKLGVPVRIYGNRWRRAREWPMLRKAWAGPELNGDEYVKAIQCAKVSLGLLSKGNRDLHTTRSAEIPYIGGVLCAERTPEHEAIYEDGKEAVFWETGEQCAERSACLLKSPDARLRIARAGRERCIKNGLLNEVVMNAILSAAR